MTTKKWVHITVSLNIYSRNPGNFDP